MECSPEMEPRRLAEKLEPDTEDPLPITKMEMDSVSGDDLPEEEPEILQIKIKEEMECEDLNSMENCAIPLTGRGRGPSINPRAGRKKRPPQHLPLLGKSCGPSLGFAGMFPEIPAPPLACRTASDIHCSPCTPADSFQYLAAQPLMEYNINHPVSLHTPVQFPHSFFSMTEGTPGIPPDTKRKRVSLSIKDKVTLLQDLENGASVKSLCDKYGIGTSTIYDLKKQKDKLLTFYSNSDAPDLMADRKTLHQAKNVSVDKVLMEWIRQRRRENFPLSRSLIMAQAKKFHVLLNISTPCEYSSGWYGKFKKRNGLSILSINGEKASEEYNVADNFVKKLNKLVSDEHLSAEQVYNAAKASLFWRHLPQKLVATAQKPPSSGLEDPKERLTVLACSNAAGTHKARLLVIGKSRNPRAFKGVRVFPVTYTANKQAGITREIFQDWFENHFVPEARAHCMSVGLSQDAKVMLILDHCPTHPSAEFLVKDNVFAVCLPPDCTSFIQPLDQGILRLFKSNYKSEFLQRMLTECNKGMAGAQFQAKANIKDAIWTAALAWDKVDKQALIHGWRNLCPSSFALDNPAEECDFLGFTELRESQLTSELMNYARSLSCPEARLLDEEAIEESFTADNDAPVALQLPDGDISENSDEESDSDEPEGVVKEKMPIDRMIGLAEELIGGMEQRSFISEQQIMAVYRIKEQLLQEKLYETAWTQMFPNSTSCPDPQPSRDENC
ncbi:jerky protein homolog [Xenopus tropicalis]|uniref:Jerky protein homolog n=2 Tax=Xenopus tropicalis TaxID=8364 RepID=A0A8J0R7Z8_XENTR|nr:jerky protein homolog [Xenopus tropicalis]XP_004919072.1 jerky protein homolog [Xenopus tropicalis]|eukprot:XP_002941410.1 PREDICTED: jerky protein homolog-like [Xenopus tropicalis]